MRITQFDEEQFSKLGGKTFKGEDYTVRVILPLAIRYEEPGRVLTVFAEPRDQVPEWAKGLPSVLQLFVAKTWLELVIEDPVLWDNSQDGPSTPYEAILTRIESVLHRLHFSFKVRRIPAKT